MNLVSAPLPLGYSCAGIVREVASGITDFQAGDRVACAGYGYANHAEVAFVPRNLAVAIPREVSFQEAAFVTVGAISMQGVRQAELDVGESVVIFGLGLLGQLTAQICAAAGCRVFGLDLAEDKIQLAKSLGMHEGMQLADNDKDIIAAVELFTRGRGADAVIITAGTSSNHPIELSSRLLRDRGRVVAVGDIKMDVPRWEYYQKEIDLRMSRSYGPGRYDHFYEEKGNDYPIGYVRWTENRNMESFLDLIAAGKVQVMPLVSHRYPIEQAADGYALFTGKAKEPYIGIMLEYDAAKSQPSMVRLEPRAEKPAAAAQSREGTTVNIGIIGAGQFAQGVLMPRLRKVPGARIAAIATGSGHSARMVADKYHCDFCTSDYHDIINSPDIDAVLITARHNLHAKMMTESMAAGKHVFVEKPLALNPEELDTVVTAYNAARQRAQDADKAPPVVMVGFNRRYSPAAMQARELIDKLGQPAVIDYRINAGYAPPDSWMHDPAVGGGRIVGEMCHSVDLVQHILQEAPVEVTARASGTPIHEAADPDTVVALLRFASGSVATVRYLANGELSVSKELMEIFCGGHVMTMDNFRQHRVVGPQIKTRRRSLLTAEKGRLQELQDFVQAIQGGALVFDWDAALASMHTVFAIQQSVRNGETIQPVQV
jgi:predicted dehydrogenase/threonine dehydrogenase-like Zn-dependent dehydrogenase